MKRTALAPALGCVLLLAGCGREEAPAPAPTPTATMATERTLVATDFDAATLGAKIEGPEGPEVTSEAVANGKTIGTVVSYVACPADTATCDPEAMPEKTRYTYVHRVTLAEGPEAAASPSPTPAAEDRPAVVEIGPTLFRMTRPAPGFNLAVGYSRSEAEAALGDPEAIKVTLDRDQLVWRVASGNGWTPGATITVWWQSTLPPEGPEKAYLLEIDGKQGDVPAPFPAEEKSDAP